MEYCGLYVTFLRLYNKYIKLRNIKVQTNITRIIFLPQKDVVTVLLVESNYWPSGNKWEDFYCKQMTSWTKMIITKNVFFEHYFGSLTTSYATTIISTIHAYIFFKSNKKSIKNRFIYLFLLFAQKLWNIYISH